MPGRIKTYLNTPFYYSEQVILVNFKLGSVLSLSPSYPFVFCIVDKGKGSKLTIRLRTSMLKRKYVIIPAKTGEQNAKLDCKMQKLESKMRNPSRGPEMGPGPWKFTQINQVQLGGSFGVHFRGPGPI